MQVRARGAAGGTHIANDLAGLHLLSRRNDVMRHVNVHGYVAVAMVNNYIKDGLVPRADGKRYSPTHLAYLTAVCALKKVLSVRDISNLIHSGEELGMDAEAMYGYFLRKLDKALSDTADTIDPNAEQKELAKLALTLALQSYAYQLACARILDILQPDSAEADPKKKRQK